ncbi:MAG: 5'-nucleotidase C-terminal domain-containing protein, partial [Bariatricus sp.]
WYQSLGKEYDTPDALSEIRARIAGGVTRTSEMQDLCVSGGYLNLEKAMTTPYPVLDSLEQNDDGSAVIEGYFFGEEGTLEMDGEIIKDIEEWTEHSVTFCLPEGTEEGKHTFRITNLTIGEDQYGEDSFLLQGAAGGVPSDSQKLFEQLAKPDFNELGIATCSDELPQNLVELEGKLYVAGSFVKTKEDGTSCPAVLVYDIDEETWNAFALPGISPEAEVNMVAGEHELYLICKEELFTVYKYLPDTGEKIKISEDPDLSGDDNVVYDSSYLVYGSDIWMIGGLKYDEDYGTEIPVKDVMLLNIEDIPQDPTLNTWRKGSELNHARAMAGAEIVDGTLIVAGGYNINDSWIYSTEIWDGTKWNEAAEFPAVYDNQQVTAASGTFGENMIVSGMLSDATYSGDTFVYNQPSDTWSLVTQKKLSDTKVYYADGVVYGDYFYVYGLTLFNNKFDVLWSRVNVNELLENEPADPDEGLIIKIVHTNDIHARVTDSSGGIGVERLKTIIDSWTSDAAMSSVIDSGDLFHGQPIATLSKGESIAKITKALGYDLMTAGNHDWSYGKDRLKELTDMADIEMLCGNVRTDSGEAFFDNEYAVYESDLPDGPNVKYGVFGTIDPQLYTSTTPSNVEGITFDDQTEYARESAKYLREELGCDIVIGLTHTLDPEEFAAQVDGVDIWLCGHEHIDLDETVTTPDGGTAYVIESGYYLQSVSLIELECFTDENDEFSGFELTHTVVNTEDAESYEKDPEMTDLLNEINEEQEGILNTVVGKTPEYLDGDWYNLRIGETNLGRAVADAYLLETGADVAFENAGGIRASIEQGDVTYGDIIGVSPYGNYIVTKKLTGAQLLDVFETSLDIQVQCIEAYERGDDSDWPSFSGSYLQFGGVTVEYDLSQPAGSRVVSANVQGEPLDPEKLYTVATNNYAAISEDYEGLANAEEIGQFRACDEALVSFFEQDDEAIANTLAAKAMIPASKCQHTDTEIRNRREASCTEEGYTGDVYCKDCGELVESGKTITKTAHTYKDGICTVCQAKDPSANPDEQKKPDSQEPSSTPKTGDENHAGVYGTMLLLSAMTIVAFLKKKSMVS